MAENNNDLTLKAIAKWRNHPSILATASEYRKRANFSFNFVSKEDVLTETKVLDVSKVIQESDVPVKMIKANKNFFAELTCFYFNKSLENGKFPNCLKLVNITAVFKIGKSTSKILVQLVFSIFFFFFFFERYLKGYLVVNF